MNFWNSEKDLFATRGQHLIPLLTNKYVQYENPDIRTWVMGGEGEFFRVEITSRDWIFGADLPAVVLIQILVDLSF